MATLFYLWLLLTPPVDREICAMWVSRPPSASQMMEACGTMQFESPYVWRAVNIYTGIIACERPASELPKINCNLYPLDHYRLVVLWPKYQSGICTLEITHSGEPTPVELVSQCPDAKRYVLSYRGTLVRTPELPPPPTCPMPELTGDLLTDDPADLSTGIRYEVLAYHLRWHFGADSEMATWQNQWDNAIYQAGAKYHVPPKVLKAIFAVEAQYWPLWSGDAEVGMGQLTDDGAGLVLHYAPDLFAELCPFRHDTCLLGYDLLSLDKKATARGVLLNRLRTSGTPRMAADQVTDQMDTWARILAAYYCATGEAVSGWGERPASERWDLTLAAYHAGPECIMAGVCAAGEEYLRKVKG